MNESAYVFGLLWLPDVDKWDLESRWLNNEQAIGHGRAENCYNHVLNNQTRTFAETRKV
jgi:hypothetical protein